MKAIPPKILAAAADCPHAHSCIQNGQCGIQPLCPVHYADGENILFLAGDDHKVCSYRFRYGHSQVCRCPVHYHLNQKG